MVGDNDPRLNRKDAIFAILMIAGVLAILFYKLKDYMQVKHPDLSLLGQYRLTMDELGEAIIPETETPGARSAGVTMMVFRLVESCLGTTDQSTFINGLKELNQYCKKRYGKNFHGCSGAERLETLYHLENEANFGGWFVMKVRRRFFGKSFIHLVKELCAISYCTSMEGATKGLVYDHVPIIYKACIPLAENQRSWATI